MGRYFGTDGFRGRVNKDLTAEHAFKIGRFIGWYFSEQRKAKAEQIGPARIVIGKDTRKSCYMLEQALCAGITSSGADVYSMHTTTTPSVALITKIDRFECGVMITASHNRNGDNGIKLFNRYGEKMDEDVIDMIEDYLDGKNEDQVQYVDVDELGRKIGYSSARNRYIGYLQSIDTFSLKGKRIAFDCANGSASQIVRPVFEALGATVYAINSTPNGTNINLKSGSTNPERLQQYVVSNHCDAGFAFDGDADRCIAVDEKGNVIDGDKLMYIAAKYMKEEGMLGDTEVVATVISNMGLLKALEENGIKYHITPVGDKNVRDYMVANNGLLGGEQSGHLIFSKYTTCGDGILTALLVSQVTVHRGKKLSKLLKGYVEYPQLLVNVAVNSKDAVMNDKDIEKTIKSIADELKGSGRVVVRASGTESLIRVMVEAEAKEICVEKTNAIVEAIKAKGYSI